MCDTIGNVCKHAKRAKGEQLGTYANMGTEQQGNNWELMQTWEQSNKGTIENVCKHGNRGTREQLGTFANTGAEQQGNNWERLQTWEQSNNWERAHWRARAREKRERETGKTTKRSLREFGVLSRKFGGRHRPLFLFVFVFLFSFFPPHGFHMDCVLFAAQCVCVCFFVERTVL